MEKYIFLKHDNALLKEGSQQTIQNMIEIPEDIGSEIMRCIESTRDVVNLSWGLSFCENVFNEFDCWCVNYANEEPFIRTEARDRSEQMARAFFHEYKSCTDHLETATNPFNFAKRYIEKNKSTVHRLFPECCQAGEDGNIHVDTGMFRSTVLASYPQGSRADLDRCLQSIRNDYPEYAAVKQFRDTLQHHQRLITFAEFVEDADGRRLIPVICPHVIPKAAMLSWKDFRYVDANPRRIDVLQMAKRALEALHKSYVPVINYMLNQNDCYKDVDYLGMASANYAKALGNIGEITSCFFGTDVDDNIFLHEVNWMALHSLRNKMKPVRDSEGNLVGAEYKITAE